VLLPPGQTLAQQVLKRGRMPRASGSHPRVASAARIEGIAVIQRPRSRTDLLFALAKASRRAAFINWSYAAGHRAMQQRTNW